MEKKKLKKKRRRCQDANKINPQGRSVCQGKQKQEKKIKIGEEGEREKTRLNEFDWKM